MRALLLVAALMFVACAHRPTGPLQTVPESAMDEARALQRGAYGERAGALKESAELARTILGSVPEARRSKVLHEPQLDRVAALVARVMLDEQRELAHKVVEELVWHAGVAAEYHGADRALFTGDSGDDFLVDHLKSVKWPEAGTALFGVARVGGWQTGTAGLER